MDSGLKFNITIAKQFMQAMNTVAEQNAHQYTSAKNLRRIIRAERTTQDITKEARLHSKQAKLELIEVAMSAEDSLYDSEVNNSI